MMGVITGCVGGTIRDILAGVPSIIVRPEIYVTAAALASGLFLILLWLGAGTPVAAVTGAVAGFILRGAAISVSSAAQYMDKERMAALSDDVLATAQRKIGRAHV